MNFNYLSEDSDLWEFRVTEFGLAPIGLAPRTRKRRQRKARRMTLARAVKEARKAGVNAGMITVDGVMLEFGERSNITNENDLDSWMAKHAH